MSPWIFQKNKATRYLYNNSVFAYTWQKTTSELRGAIEKKAKDHLNFYHVIMISEKFWSLKAFIIVVGIKTSSCRDINLGTIFSRLRKLPRLIFAQTRSLRLKLNKQNCSAKLKWDWRWKLKFMHVNGTAQRCNFN